MPVVIGKILAKQSRHQSTHRKYRFIGALPPNRPSSSITTSEGLPVSSAFGQQNHSH